MKFPYYRQYDAMDCGPTCLRMIAKYYGKSLSMQYLRQQAGLQRGGVTLLGISEAAEAIGFRTLAARIDYNLLCQEIVLPCIVHWNQNHFVIVYRINKKKVWMADPGRGLVTISRNDFERGWLYGSQHGEAMGIALMMEPSAAFNTEDEAENKKVSIKHILGHFKRHRKLFVQLVLGILIGVVLQTVLPFLTQSVVDVGIPTKDINFITLVLIGQLMIFIGSTGVDFLRSWILLHISTRINISLLTEFFIKLMRLPMSYFDVKMTGDIMQRMGDHSRVQGFLTNTLLDTSMSVINFIVFTFLAVAYDVKLFLIFLAGSLLYIGWIALFMRARKRIDFKRFSLSSANQNTTIEIVQGMQEIKLNNCERQKRWAWERMQVKLFKLSTHSLFINQLQSTGALFINQGKNVLITFLAAKAVIDGQLTLGGMMAVQYIIGQLNSPVQQIIGFIQSLQDARISMERINEIQQMENEEPLENTLSTVLPTDKTIHVKALNYRYPGYDNEYVLQDMNIFVPQGKTTAIVGTSGSGKTTLLKLLLRFYKLEEGDIRVGGIDIKAISPSYWRSKCGVVMQDGYIFSDTIAANIAVGEEFPDPDRLLHAVTVANITDFIKALPMGFNTRIGAQGSGISQGQKQRILIARAVYKDPEYIFFDEATNSLDANNESVIMKNLESFFLGRTVVVVAHRLSTVKNADQIIVLEKGRVAEWGTHAELTALKRSYYQLVKNQLELGN